MELNGYLLELLKKTQRDFITLRAVRDSLPTELLKSLKLIKGKSPLSSVRKKITPYLGERSKVFEGSRTNYLGLNFTTEELIFRVLQKKPDASSKQLRNRLPFKNADFVAGLNNLLASGRIICEIHPKTHQPKS